MNYETLLQQVAEGFPSTERLMDYNARTDCSFKLSQAINQFDFTNQSKKWLEDVKTDGISSLGVCLSPEQVQKIQTYFSSKNVYNGHVIADSDGIARKLEDYPYKYACYDNHDTVNAPHLLDLAFNEDILNLVENYIGCTPTIFSMNCWWTLPGNQKSGIEKFHRDWDDYKFLALFIYLTDVDEESGGAHCFLKKFHTPEALNGTNLKNHFHEFNDMQWYEQNCPELISTYHAPAGHGFIADTFSLHKGNPSLKPRLALWIRYGYLSNSVHKADKGRELALFNASEKDRMAKLSEFRRMSEKQNYMTRLLINHD